MGEPVWGEGEETGDVGIEDVMRVLERPLAEDEHLEEREREQREYRVGDPRMGDEGPADAGHRGVSSPLRWFGASFAGWDTWRVGGIYLI